MIKVINSLKNILCPTTHKTVRRKITSSYGNMHAIACMIKYKFCKHIVVQWSFNHTLIVMAYLKSRLQILWYQSLVHFEVVMITSVMSFYGLCDLDWNNSAQVYSPENHLHDQN